MGRGGRNKGTSWRKGGGGKKRKDGEGEYPPAHILENECFLSYYRDSGLVPADEMDSFAATLRKPLCVSFGITGGVHDPAAIALRDYMEREHLSKMQELVVGGQRVPPPTPISWISSRLSWKFDVSRSVLRGKGQPRKPEGAEAAHGEGEAGALATEGERAAKQQKTQQAEAITDDKTELTAQAVEEGGEGEGGEGEGAASSAVAASSAAPLAPAPAPELTADESRSSATLSAFHKFLTAETELGHISRQEEVSMVPPVLLNPQPGDRVLDMCAAPGSKTQQLIQAISAPSPPSVSSPQVESAVLSSVDPSALCASDRGFVLANDSDYKRCHLLVHQAKRLNSPALIVTNHDANFLPSNFLPSRGSEGPRGSEGAPPLRFERILCDVPCSGDGTLRKAPDLWRRWTDTLALGVHRQQLNILIRGLQLLAPGGRLVYSTCSMNPIEDEAVVAAALTRTDSGASLVSVAGELPGLKRRPGISSWRVRSEGEWYTEFGDMPEEAQRGRYQESMFPPPPAVVASLGLEHTMRVLPHQQDTGGFFIAVFEKPLAVGMEGAEAAEGAPKEGVPKEGLPQEAAEEAAASKMPPSNESGGVEGAEGAEGAPKEGVPKAGGGSVQVAPSEAAAATSEAAAPSEAAATAPAAAESSADASAASIDISHKGLNGAKIAPWVLGTLHCASSNNGRYDSLYTIRPELLSKIRSYFGLSDRFAAEQFVTRSVVGKSIFFISANLLNLIKGDASTTKLKIVNTGVRVLERTDERGLPFPFRLSQEGANSLLPHMSKQLLFASTDDFVRLLKNRSVPLANFGGEGLREALTLAPVGCKVVVHDPSGCGRLDPEKPLPLFLVAMKPVTRMALESLIRKEEADSMLKRLTA